MPVEDGVDPLRNVLAYRVDTQEAKERVQHQTSRDSLVRVDKAIQGLNGIRSQLKELYNLSVKGQGTGFSRVDRQAYQASIATIRREIDHYDYNLLQPIALGSEEKLDESMKASGVRLAGLYEAIGREANMGADVVTLDLEEASLLTSKESRISEEKAISADDYTEALLQKISKIGYELLRSYGVVASRLGRSQIPEQLLESSQEFTEELVRKIYDQYEKSTLAEPMSTKQDIR